MSLLIDRSPVSVEISGRKWKINADFRTSILFEMLQMDWSVPDDLKLIRALELYYPDVPTDIPSAVEKMIWFYRCGKNPRQNIGGGGRLVKIYDYEQDDSYIYAAFLADYGIDLESISFLHWWKFKALFDSLRSENTFCKIMEFRAADTSRMKGEQKTFYQKMKRMYALRRPKEEQDKLDEIAETLMK